MNENVTELWLICCASRKRPSSCPARLLYDESTLFRYSRDYVESYSYPYCILSAKYGLLEPDTVISPYNLTLLNFDTDAHIEWSERVFKQLMENYPNVKKLHLYTGNAYEKYLIPLLEANGIEYEQYLKHYGIGQKVKWFKDHINPKKKAGGFLWAKK